ncbi:type II toxin-antitoxin system death-on-curing family toxin [Caulobacter flavus]|uniref:Type II toxin-antitoxin system death-on-curing family toxin n=1 Tax=Caulobacter flavus TaxID=1679497 RepID=A0A2N5CRQ3_9CAUL|nr:type II toxin-antitoxin system death-on-curing family toxin [Caulobacter flavus]AYV46380.1 type II toxin-antitoxin system death-on-curing family toxin [Caulobacter flavus]PLR12677.1 type II toxin-antitoxin system death-on-curing family toxin [Caulobacter flavus]
MSEPVWIDEALLVRWHDLVLAETGGAKGVRDSGLLNSALARPTNRYAYEGLSDLVELAATYALAIASNHPFVDGNKRAAFMALGMFLEDNGLWLAAEPDDATKVMFSVAAGEIGIAELTDWLRPRVVDAP